jgi:hypothetical protein
MLPCTFRTIRVILGSANPLQPILLSDVSSQPAYL